MTGVSWLTLASVSIINALPIYNTSLLYFRTLDQINSFRVGIEYLFGFFKLSLLLILAGLETATSGSVAFENNDKALSNLVLRQKSGFVFQQFHLLAELDTLNNVALPLKLKGDKLALDKAFFWLKQVGLEYRSKHKPNELSVENSKESQ
ncbi:hypothetical protein CJF42_11200 [Pseudoalteromonas sp. NBT06-2]|uniref:hypothetical protein n=1 Tax=Pseudoalteromonas sp. NBT06-2 TaxID=2025950 RepID=UPI000BA7296F|nr:hypothetical protein [Pseudoalteromonas sp. NBT06-2]PAJ74310.1 hypothetical protein CJF42_11200 [Pseudoalteromonas sp. NBT06-2]